MVFDEDTAQRPCEYFQRHDDIVEKYMFGGIAFMHSGNTCCGVVNDTSLARIGPHAREEAVPKPNAREVDCTGKAVTGSA